MNDYAKTITAPGMVPTPRSTGGTNDADTSLPSPVADHNHPGPLVQGEADRLNQRGGPGSALSGGGAAKPAMGTSHRLLPFLAASRPILGAAPVLSQRRPAGNRS